MLQLTLLPGNLGPAVVAAPTGTEQKLVSSSPRAADNNGRLAVGVRLLREGKGLW